MLSATWIKLAKKIVITFSDATTCTLLGSDRLVNVTTTKQLSNNNTDPLGKVSSNTISIDIIDDDKDFVINNTSSPYYGLLGLGFKIEYFKNVDNTGWVKAGEFYSTDISSKTQMGKRTKTTIVGTGKLQYTKNNPVNVTSIKKNVTVIEAYTLVFTAAGLTSGEYNIASTLTKTLKYFYSYGEDLGTVLNTLSQSYMACVFEDDNGIIQVVDMLELVKNTTPVFEFNGNSTATDFLIGTNLISTYNAVKLNYTNPTYTKDKELFSIDSFKVPVGTSDTSEFTFSDKLYDLNYYVVKPKVAGVDIAPTIKSCNQNSLVLTLLNPSEAEVEASIKVSGGVIEANSAVLTKNKSGADTTKLKYMTIEAPYIQTDSYAVDASDIYIKWLGTEILYITLKSTKINPLLTVGSIVKAVSNLQEIDLTCIVTEIKMAEGVGTVGNVTLINSAALL